MLLEKIYSWIEKYYTTRPLFTLFMKTRFNFDVRTLEGLESSFERERKRGGYEALYTSQKKRLIREQEAKNKSKK